MWRWSVLLVFLVAFLVIVAVAGRASAANGSTDSAESENQEQPKKSMFFVQGEMGVALFGRLVAMENPFNTFAYGARFGVRPGRWDFFLHVEQAFYGSPKLGEELTNSVFNAGLGAGFTYFDGHVRASLSVGPCVLLTSSMINDPGTVGFYVEARATQLRFPVGRIIVVVDPLTFSLAVPVVVNVSLVHISYRTFVGVEVEF